MHENKHANAATSKDKFGSALDDYMTASCIDTQDESAQSRITEEWTLDPHTGYYFNEGNQMYSYWDGAQWIYINKDKLLEKEKLNIKQEHNRQSDENEDVKLTKKSLEDGEISDSNDDDRNTRSSMTKPTHDRTNILKPHVPSGFIPSKDPHYFYNPAKKLWYDTQIQSYTRFDETSRAYIMSPSEDLPSIPDSDNEIIGREPQSDATLRLVVVDSKVLQTGSVVLVDANGLSMGRDRSWDKRLRLPEMETSKFHCQIYYDDGGCDQKTRDTSIRVKEDTTIAPSVVGVFQLIDTGSQNGTFINDVRLSDSKTSSAPFKIAHDDMITVGSTKFKVHQHASGWLCEECQVKDGNLVDVDEGSKPSYSQNNSIANTSINVAINPKKMLEAQRRDELRRLKRKYTPISQASSVHLDNSSLVAHHEVKLSPSLPASERKYVDRAKLRREFQPSVLTSIMSQSHITTPPEFAPSPPSTTSTSSLDTKLSSDNVGNRLLQKMGWKEGTALGKHEVGGIIEPIRIKVLEGRSGIGSTIDKKQKPEDDILLSQESFNERNRRLARERYNEIFNKDA